MEMDEWWCLDDSNRLTMAQSEQFSFSFSLFSSLIV
jgi:hypothetical protein